MNNHTPSILETVWAYKWTFVIIICVMFAVTFTGLYLIGFVPDELAPGDDSTIVAGNTNQAGQKNPIPGTNAQGSGATQVATVYPEKISIPAVGDSTIIQNPTSTDVEYLDSLLLKGSVRYPGSGTPGKGNMFLFAHSTSIKVVHNQAYKAFNDLDKLSKGDEIDVQSSGKMYVYKVRTVSKSNEAVAKVNIADTRNMLTLSTCDTFSGIKQQRIIVEADFDHSYNL